MRLERVWTSLPKGLNCLEIATTKSPSIRTHIMMDEEEFQDEEGSGEEQPTSERNEGEEGEEDEEEVMEVEETHSGSPVASGSEVDEEEAAAVPTRGRGRGRVRARGGIRGRPRGRGRGGRGVGRGRGRKVIVLRRPKSAASPGESGDGASSDGETPGADEAAEAEGKP